MKCYVRLYDWHNYYTVYILWFQKEPVLTDEQVAGKCNNLFYINVFTKTIVLVFTKPLWLKIKIKLNYEHALSPVYPT